MRINMIRKALNYMFAYIRSIVLSLSCRGGQSNAALDYMQQYGLIQEDLYTYVGLFRNQIDLLDEIKHHGVWLSW